MGEFRAVSATVERTVIDTIAFKLLFRKLNGLNTLVNLVNPSVYTYISTVDGRKDNQVALLLLEGTNFVLKLAIGVSGLVPIPSVKLANIKTATQTTSCRRCI